MRGTHPGSHDEILTFHDALGYPQRGLPSTELEQSQLGALCHRRPSMGSIVARLALSYSPKPRVRRVVLIAPPNGGVSPAFRLPDLSERRCRDATDSRGSRMAHGRPCSSAEAFTTAPGRPDAPCASQAIPSETRKTFLREPVHLLGCFAHLVDHRSVMIIEVGQRRIHLFRLQIGVLPKQLFGAPAVMVMLGGQVNHLVPGLPTRAEPSSFTLMCG